jgi:hypothetical protein
MLRIGDDALANFVEYSELLGARECPLALHHLIDNAAQCPHINLAVIFATLNIVVNV